ncbi:MAG: HD family phosphohydrolase [Halanaerobiales bacterium]
MLKKIKNWWNDIPKKDIFSGKKSKKILWGILFLILLSVIITIDLFPGQDTLNVGQVSNQDIIAPRTTTFIDEERTEELREMAAESAPGVYEEKQNVENDIKKKIDNLFQLSLEIKETEVEDSEQSSNSENKTEELANKLREESELDLSDETTKLLITGDEDLINELHETTNSIMDRQLEQRILPDELDDIKEEMAEIASEQDLPQVYNRAAVDILQSVVEPNMILNEEASEERRKETMEQIEPVRKNVRQGEVIIRKGDVVDEEDIRVLEALGLQKKNINYLNIIGLEFLVILVIFIGAYYIREYQKDVWEDNKKLILIELLILITVLLAKITSIFQLAYLMYLVPVAAASILIAVLINSQIAVVITAFISILVALVFNGVFEPIIISFIGGLVGIYSVSKVSQRSDLVRAGFNVSGILVLLISGMMLFSPTSSWINVMKALSMGVLNGILVAILSNGLLPYLENGFGFTSAVKLLELSNPSQPLLKRMLVEAPGTYHHSIIVGNLAEAAADNIEGADSLLARVGAYYHDIGKLKRPYFFSDNQFGGDNPHDKISANLSALIIKSHVKDGVELAKKHKLPEAIIDIIKQHQGTNLISYFYQQAIKDSKHDEIEENDFRYDGPKPQFKEAAIIMLADIVEATVRSKQFNKNNHNRIESLVRGLIREKLTENQLDECDLSLKDLDIIAENFVKVLTGIYHQRIEYPDNLLKEVKEDDNNDNSS